MVSPFMLILHANWYQGSLQLWGESVAAFQAARPSDESESTRSHARDESDRAERIDGTEAAPAAEGGSRTAVQEHRPSADNFHPFAASPAELIETLRSFNVIEPSQALTERRLTLRLPFRDDCPQPSHRLVSLTGALEGESPLKLRTTSVHACQIPNEQALSMLLRLEDLTMEGDLTAGASLRYWFVVARFVLELLSDQRFIPTVIQARGQQLAGTWRPWLHDSEISNRIGALVLSMPPVVRAVVDSTDGRPWPILEDALAQWTDATVRRILRQAEFHEALDDLDPEQDAHVAWLNGLLQETDAVSAPGGRANELLRDVRSWIHRLDETGRDLPLRLCFRLNEPAEDDREHETGDAVIEDAGDHGWLLSLHLQPAVPDGELIDADQIWSQSGPGMHFAGCRVEQCQDVLLKELGRASRVYRRIESALSDATPSGIELTTSEAYEFLRDHKPVLEESGFRVIAPDWWGETTGRIGLRLHVEADHPETHTSSEGESAPSDSSSLGLHTLVQYTWQVAIGDDPINREEFERLLARSEPLMRVRGRWVEIRPDDLARAKKLLEEQGEGEMSLLEAVQAAYDTSDRGSGLPVFGLDATGWVQDLLNASTGSQNVPIIEQPKGFQGELRPYQRTGLSWLAFLDKFHLGACLADDMGLGKTIQLIALLQHERQNNGAPPGPTLLVVPTSVISNWVREIERFTPGMSVHVQHGPERPTGTQFVDTVYASDVVLTTYALVSRDREMLTDIDWHRVVLDEAQYIKNPPTKQTSAIRALRTKRRIALTGTPVENRLSELWSIMEFCNPGYLGTTNEFRRRFAIPIERHRDAHRGEMLRQLVQPFVLRRLKTDPNVISDLPACVETKEYATLHPEQAALYERTVNEMLESVEKSEGIQRRGLVLASLVKLKQICDHPQLVNQSVRSGSAAADTPHPPAHQSGKVRRLLELLEDVRATGEKALIFTQFRKMGHLLHSMLRSEFECESLFLHGGTPQARRQQLIDRFHETGPEVPFFILSLKAGGVGLNLTAANHVFHFDRWWNPAVENQATDRAFRIGQVRTVHVHKFVCVGTLEERIDQMIEQKTELAERIVGSGESWLTELDTNQLQDLLTLRRSAMEDDS
ncbi:MAG: DEAD/DEAH box helicase [Phycisphaerales bacterium]|nr:MAG: DEAD/DEAH box helicase [Phycisphaerales bacterium]